ncbi:imelysin family protein [Parabacteroides sp.]
MKKRSLFAMMLMGCSLISFQACSDDDDPEPNNGSTEWTLKNIDQCPDSGTPTEAQMSAVLANFADEVALPTYKTMVENMQKLQTAVNTFAANPTDNALADACEQWRNARIYWEQSEAFLFGPAAQESFDPSMDSWPLDKNGIDQIIKTGNWSAIEGEVDEDENAENPAQNLRGFHTIEYLMFKNGEAKKAADLTQNEIIYLQKAVTHLVNDGNNLHKAWEQGLNDDIIPTSFAEALKKHDGSAYSLRSANAALELLLNGEDGMAAIANEVGESKIGVPADDYVKDLANGLTGEANSGVLGVESWYSWNSLDDYEDNIQSIRNCYFGGHLTTSYGQDDKYTYDEENPKGISALVKIINPTLDSLVIDQIDKTILAIRAIPAPFRNHLDASEVKAAREECANLKTALDKVRAKLQD